ncbi:FAD binding domain-containing protein [bacterium]|nr:FAD binding domain-containing protein [bacterium]
MVNAYFRPKSAEEAATLLASEKDAVLLAGGTYLLTSQFAKKPMAAIAISGLLPAAIERHGERVIIGAGATFQALAEAPGMPKALRDAALAMADRNIRNRATVGGNIGADKSCASLVPFFLVAEARYSRVGALALGAAEWQALPAAERGIAAAVEFAAPTARRFAYERYARTSCDVAVLTCAASAEFETAGGGLAARGLRIAMGGLSPHARRFPELERLFEGAALPGKAAIEAAAAPLFSPVSDARGSAEFKRARAAALLADVLAALANPEANETPEARP